MKGCDTTGGRKYAILKPIGFNATTIINVQKSCACQNGDNAKPKRVWADEIFPDGKQPHCSDSGCSYSRETLPSEECRQHQDQPICSGRGDCIEGKCFCYKNKLGRVYGKYCQMDDFSCPYHQGNLCSGKLQNLGLCFAFLFLCFIFWNLHTLCSWKQWCKAVKYKNCVCRIRRYMWDTDRIEGAILSTCRSDFLTP